MSLITYTTKTLITCGLLLLCVGYSQSNAQINHTFTWMDGSDVGNQTRVYGVKGVPDPANNPGGRHNAVSWTDPEGTFWLFGGRSFQIGNNSFILNDLWKWDSDTGLWTWVSGSDAGAQPGTYGVKGIPNPANVPGARQRAESWTGTDGSLWMFGGFGYDKNSDIAYLNDLWKFDPATGLWTWISGSDTYMQAGIYGVLGTPDPANVPGARYNATSWTDQEGNFWLFGGNGIGKNGVGFSLNDLWKWNRATEQWTWMSGSDIASSLPNYGIQGTPASSNVPGARSRMTSWTAPDGALWLFGGDGRDKNGIFGYLNDLWKWDSDTGLWTWVSGSDVHTQSGTYGEKGVPDPSNVPGSRGLSVTWTGPDGDLWLFGGFVVLQTGAQWFNDLWKFNPDNGLWTWVSGSEIFRQAGTYGVQGAPDPSNVPGARYGAINWADQDGALWLFGGQGQDINGNSFVLNDLWRINTSPASLVTGAANSGVSIAQDGESSFDFESDFTIEMWIKQNGSAPFQAVFSTQKEGAMNAIEISPRPNGNVEIRNDLFLHLNTVDGVIQANKWTHLAYVRSGMSQTLYVNGEVVSLVSDSPQPISNNTDPVIFGNGLSMQIPFQGNMSDLRIWSTARTEQQIKDGQFTTVQGKETGLAGAWFTRKTGIHGAIDLTRTKANAQLAGAIEYAEEFPPMGAFIYGDEGWRMLGRPTGDVTYASWIDGLWTQGFPDAGNSSGLSNVYFWDEAARQWKAPASITNIVGTDSDVADPDAGGFIMWVYEDDEPGTPGSFPKLLSTEHFETIADHNLDLDYTDSGIYGDDGWNLVYNPYPAGLYWQLIVDANDNVETEDYIYLYNPALNAGNGGYMSHFGMPMPPGIPGSTTFNGVIPAFQGFWVKAESDEGQLRIKTTHQVQNRPLYRPVPPQDDPRKVFAITLEGEGFENHASIVFDANDETHIKLPALRSLNHLTAEISLFENQSRWNILSVNPADLPESVSYSYDLEATVPGSYELNWPGLEEFGSDWEFILTDHHTGYTTMLVPGQSYAFTVEGESNREMEKTGAALGVPYNPLAERSEKGIESRFSVSINMGQFTSLGNDGELPRKVALGQNYPNPFNPVTNLQFDLPEAAQTRLDVYDVIGRRVATLLNEHMQAGTHTVQFDASRLASGVYLYRLEASGTVITKSMTLIK